MSETFKPVKEIWRGGTGVPLAHYRLKSRGEVVGFAQTAAAALAWLDHPGRQTPDIACFSVIDGVEREVTRNGGAS